MKKFFLYVIAQIAALGIVSYFLTGFQIKGDVWVFVGLAIVISLINFFIKPVIKFFTLPINFFTFGLFNLVVAVALLYLLAFVFPIAFNAGEFRALSIGGVISLSPIAMTSLGTLIMTALSMSLLSALIDFLVDK